MAEESLRKAEEALNGSDDDRTEEEEERRVEEIAEEIATIAERADDAALDVAIDIGVNTLERMIETSKRRAAFAYADEDAGDGLVQIPYTRAQYLALPRKKKKIIMMNVKKLVRYSATRKMIDALSSVDSTNRRITSRIAVLETRLAEEGRLLPNTGLWVEAVQRLRK